MSCKLLILVIIVLNSKFISIIIFLLKVNYIDKK
jgi:hypothetical protein